MKLPVVRSCLLLCLLLAVGSPASAQGAAPREPAKDSKDPKAEAEAAAMERARRLAANPMRMIIEASRTKRRDNEPAAAVPVAAAAATTTAATTASASPAAAAPEVVPRAAPPQPAPQPAPPAVVAPAPTTVISSQLSQASATGPTPALEAAPLARQVATPALPAALPMAPSQALSAEPARPQLLSRVDPEPPQRLLADIDPNTVITVDLLIRADGSVAQVTLVTPNQRALARYVISALQQWRFAPLPSERTWRVELLFRPE